MRLSTTNFRAAGLREIVFEIQPEAAELARWFLNYFESHAKSGTRFEDGQTVELGWSLLQLRQVGDSLEAYEPDFDSMPIRWCRGVNNTVRYLHIQRAVCDLFGCEPMFPSIRHAGIVSSKFAGSREFTMSRDIPSESDSGWVFAENGYTGSGGEFCSLYQLALQKIEIVPFLALPSSSRILIKPGLREVILGESTQSSDDCDLLRRLADGGSTRGLW